MPEQALLENYLVCFIGTMDLKGILGNINAQFANSTIQTSLEKRTA
jgi:hypothetical protein